MKNRSLLKRNTALYIFIFFTSIFAWIHSIHARSNKSEKVIIRPDSGGVYSVGAECQIILLSTLEADSITIEYTINNGDIWHEIEDSIITDTSSDTMHCFWTIPTIQDSSDSCKIRLKNTETDSVIDESDDFFTIRFDQATISLVQPQKNKNDTLNLGQKLEIKWSITGYPKIDSVNIEMYINNGSTRIVVASNISGQSTYLIYIPYIPDSETIYGGKIKISDAANPDKYFDSTIVPFSIINSRNSIKYNYYKSSLSGTPSIKTDIASHTLDIKFSIVKRENIYIDFFALNGTRIRNIYRGTVDKGKHSVQYNYGDLISGCFLLKFKIGEKVFVKNIIHSK